MRSLTPAEKVTLAELLEDVQSKTDRERITAMFLRSLTRKKRYQQLKKDGQLV